MKETRISIRGKEIPLEGNEELFHECDYMITEELMSKSDLCAGGDLNGEEGAISVYNIKTGYIIYCGSFDSKKSYENKRKEILDLGIKFLEEKNK